MSPLAAEFFGTAILILLGNGVVANVILKGTKGSNGGWMVITAGWAFAVFAGVAVAGPYSGAHLNPAVTLGLAIAGKFSWHDVLPYMGAQLAGSFVGAIVVWIVYRDHFTATEDADTRLAVFSTGPAIHNRMFNFLSEIVGTFVLIFVIFYFTGAELTAAAGAHGQPVGLGTVGALPVTLLVWAIGLSLGGTTGYAINPARDFGPRIAHTVLPLKGSSNWSYAWVPILGPLAGATLAALLYLALK